MTLKWSQEPLTRLATEYGSMMRPLFRRPACGLFHQLIAVLLRLPLAGYLPGLVEFPQQLGDLFGILWISRVLERSHQAIQCNGILGVVTQHQMALLNREVHLSVVQIQTAQQVSRQRETGLEPDSGQCGVQGLLELRTARRRALPVKDLRQQVIEEAIVRPARHFLPRSE